MKKKPRKTSPKAVIRHEIFTLSFDVEDLEVLYRK